MGLADFLVGRRVLFYTLLALYGIGIVLRGRACSLAAALIPLVPFTLVLALTVDFILKRDYATALSGVVLLAFLVGWRIIS